MDDAPPVSVIEGAGDLDTPGDDAVNGGWRPADDLTKRIALDVLEHDERQPVDVLDLVHPADVGMAESRRMPRLL